MPRLGCTYFEETLPRREAWRGGSWVQVPLEGWTCAQGDVGLVPNSVNVLVVSGVVSVSRRPCCLVFKLGVLYVIRQAWGQVRPLSPLHR